MLRFQSTFPRGERLWHIRDYRHIMLFQSTFPRGERRLLPERRDAMLGNFNPRSLVGNDVSVQRNLYRGFNFNPRSLVGNDGCRCGCALVPISISIHVPSWGTTANFHKYSLFFYAINIIFLLFIIPSLFSLVLFMLLF